MKSKTEATDKRQEARSSLLAVPSFSGYLLQQSKELPSGSPGDHLQCDPPLSRRPERRARAARQASSFTRSRAMNLLRLVPFFERFLLLTRKQIWNVFLKNLKLEMRKLEFLQGFPPQDVGQDYCPFDSTWELYVRVFFFFKWHINLVIRGK